MFYILLYMIINIAFHITCAEKTTLINNDFFKDIVGMDEKTFQTTFISRPIVFSREKQIEWSREYPRRAAIFYMMPMTKRVSVTTTLGKINIYRGLSVAEYEELIVDPKPLTNKPSFSIQFFDPSKPEDSDIRWLQANPELKDAVFQIASNFNTLEGGMGFQDALLTNMLHAPVQGELASISAAPATINRKYFLAPFNLLYRLGKNGIEMNESDGFANPTDQTLQKISDGSIKVSEINYKDIAVCLQPAVVTSGSGGTGKNDEVKRLVVMVNDDGTIDEDKTQIVYQVFTAALDLRKFIRGPLNPNLASFAKLIIKGSYVGTFKAAYYIEEEKVFLTIMGGGSFRNDIGWIAEALEESESFIKEKGMQVVLMYRPDKPRDFPVRTAAGDIDFLKRMVKLANKINNTSHNLDALIQNYVTKAYDVNRPSYIIEAQQLQEKFPLNNFYTPTPSKAPSIPPTTTVPPTTIPSTSPPLAGIPTDIITLLNKFTEKLHAVDTILKVKQIEKVDDTIYKVGSKTIKLVVGDITAQKGIDVLVNAANTSITTVGGGGVAAAIDAKMTQGDHKQFEKDIVDHYKITTGQPGGAYIGRLEDGSFLNKLGYKYLINAVGPICSSGEDVNLVGNAYSNSLQEAAKVGAKSIIIPRISAIIFACPADKINKLAVETVVKYLTENPSSSLETVYLIFYHGQPKDLEALENYKTLLNEKIYKK